MNGPKKYEPEPVQADHLDAFLKRINENGKGMPTHIVIGHDGMPMYGHSIPFTLITGGTLLSDPYSDRDLRVVAFEEIDDSHEAIMEAGCSKPPVIVRIVVRGSDDDKMFLEDYN